MAGLSVARQQRGVPVGGRFAPQPHTEADIVLVDVPSWGIDRFTFVRKRPQVVDVANGLLGAGASQSDGDAWRWWRAYGTFETVGCDVELRTGQPSLRGDEFVERMRWTIRHDGPEALFEPAPSCDIDPELDVSGWVKLVRFDGNLWVLDGHHRLTAAAAESVPATVLVADLDAYRARVSATAPLPLPDGDGMADHICDDHFENESFSWDVAIVDDPGESDGVEFVTLEELDEWHVWAHRLGLSEHCHQ